MTDLGNPGYDRPVAESWSPICLPTRACRRAGSGLRSSPRSPQPCLQGMATGWSDQVSAELGLYLFRSWRAGGRTMLIADCEAISKAAILRCWNFADPIARGLPS